MRTLVQLPAHSVFLVALHFSGNSSGFFCPGCNFSISMDVSSSIQMKFNGFILCFVKVLTGLLPMCGMATGYSAESFATGVHKRMDCA